MMKEVKGYRILEGVRGEPAVDLLAGGMSPLVGRVEACDGDGVAGRRALDSGQSAAERQ